MRFAELILNPHTAKVEGCTAVACGAEFTMWLCDGHLFSAGMQQYGQLGHDTDGEYNAKDCEPPVTPSPPYVLSLSMLKQAG